jgi:Ca-activated chloride channel family protein
MSQGAKMIRCLSAAVAALIVAVPAAPQRPAVFRVSSETVAVYATVRQRDGTPALGLTKADFELFDNGSPQPIAVFSVEIQPITIGLLLDRSGSTAKRWADVNAAANAFFDQLDPPDRASLSSLNFDCVPLTADKMRLKNALRVGMPKDMGSPIWDSLDRIFGSLAPESGRRAVLIFSDGENTQSALNVSALENVQSDTDCTAKPTVSDTRRDEVARRAEREGFLVYAVSVDSTFGGTIGFGGDAALRSLARDSGGERYHLGRDEELTAAFTQVADELHHQYLLGFVPPVFDGKLHEIDVRVKRPGATVRARKRYLAALDPTANDPARTPPAPVSPLSDDDVARAVADGSAGQRLQAACTTSPLTGPPRSRPTYADVTIEGPMGRVMRAAREARGQGRKLIAADVPDALRMPLVYARVDMREAVSIDENPTTTRTSRPPAAADRIRLRSLPPSVTLLDPLSPPAGPSGEALPLRATFDLAAFRSLPGRDLEVLVYGLGNVARCKLDAADRASIR